MATVEHVLKLLGQAFPEDRLMTAEVPVAERSIPRREEYVHFRVSEVAWVESIGARRVRMHLTGGRAVETRGELADTLALLQATGYAFVRTHRQTAVRLDLLTEIEQA